MADVPCDIIIPQCLSEFVEDNLAAAVGAQ